MAILKIGKAHNEAGKKFFASENLQEIEGVLYFNDDVVFHSGNFSVGNFFIGNGSLEKPFDWKGFSIQNSSGVSISDKVTAIRQGTGAILSIGENGDATISIDLSNYTGTTVSIAGNGSKLSLNGVWSLTDGNSVKLASETDKHTAYLFSNDTNHEYPILKAKSNKSGGDREYLLLTTQGEVPIDNLPIASNATLGLVYVNGNNLSLSSNGLIGWTGFGAKNSNNTVLSSVIKELKAGDNVEFSVSGNVLTLKTTAPQNITVDSEISSTSINPVQNKVIYSELSKKISDPGNGKIGQILSKSTKGYEWIDQSNNSGSGIVDISQILIQRPISDYELYPRVEASNSSTFEKDSTIVLDPTEDNNDRFCFKVYNSENKWIDFPENSGLGTPFDGTSVSVNISKFSSLNQPYYIRYCWKVSGGADSNYKSMIFPSVNAPAPLINTSDEGTLPIPGTDDIGKVPIVEMGTDSPYYKLKEVNFSGNGSSVKRFIIQRPVSELELFPIIKASQTPSFSSCQEISPKENPTDSKFIKIFSGEEWIDFPENSGLGTPFDEATLAIDTNKFVGFVEPYYIKYCWVDSNGSESNYKSTMFPSTNLNGSQIVKNPVAGFDFGYVIRVLSQSEYDNLEIKDSNTLYFITE